jgi:23S rRNA (cytosine1962-C5)-methyltransferase
MNIEGKVVLKRDREHSVARFHPWIFSGAIQRIEGEVTDGCWVEIINQKGKCLGFGHYQNGSIAVRILSFGDQPITDSFWENKFSNARQTRAASHIPSEQTNAYRLVHGEGDGLPGLIVDVYNDTAIVQAHDVGMHRDRHIIAQAIKSVCGDQIQTVYYKSHGTLPGQLRNKSLDEYLIGSKSETSVVKENNNRFHIDWEEGQKTGFFLDQRENRKLLQHFSKDKKILNTFCYTGGFSVYALQAGATLVHSVDASAKAIELTERNLELNGFDKDVHQCYAMDTFDFLKQKTTDYDVIILDPPAFAKHRDARHQAVKGYQRLNAEAMKSIRSGGIIFTFSCSQVVDNALFYNTIVSAAIQAGRHIKVLHHLSQPADHPVSIFHPEGEYLKGLVLYVE